VSPATPHVAFSPTALGRATPLSTNYGHTLRRDARGDDATPIVTTSRRLSPGQALAIARERILWNRRAESWDSEGSAGLTKVVDAVLEECRESPGGVALDLGCGSGQVTIQLAGSYTRVLAVDVSAPAIALLESKSAAEGVENIQALTHPIQTLELAPASLDLIVSNYALHHLRDVDKAELMRSSFRWLRPGGRLVIGDMMIGRGTERADRVIISGKVRGMISRGPAGWWRLAKNVWRFGLRLGEKPLPSARWESLVAAAGLVEIHTQRVVAEACVLSATKPLTSDTANPAVSVGRSGKNALTLIHTESDKRQQHDLISTPRLRGIVRFGGWPL
jgi:SAM-dependent methyltransferase